MRSLRARLSFILVAVITNLGGGPMAWAHLAPNGGHCHSMPAPAVHALPHCHEQAQAHHQPQPGHPLPCCDGGSCACAAAPLPLAAISMGATDARHDTDRAPLVMRNAAPDPLDDTLRPPIR